MPPASKKEAEEQFYSLGQYMAFFSIPSLPNDGEWALWYNAPRRRAIIRRPDTDGCARAYLAVMTSQLKGHEKTSVQSQKALLRSIFSDAGWEAARVMQGMETAEDFYMQEIAQVKIPHWYKGRVGLIGDAAYCPSPISGMGTSLAILGAYVLAGEMTKCGGDWERGFRGYEEKMRPLVKEAQSLPPGMPGLIYPETRWGIRVMLGILWVVSSNWILMILQWAGGWGGANGVVEELPGDYKF